MKVGELEGGLPARHVYSQAHGSTWFVNVIHNADRLIVYEADQAWALCEYGEMIDRARSNGVAPGQVDQVNPISLIQKETELSITPDLKEIEIAEKVPVGVPMEDHAVGCCDVPGEALSVYARVEIGHIANLGPGLFGDALGCLGVDPDFAIGDRLAEGPRGIGLWLLAGNAPGVRVRLEILRKDGTPPCRRTRGYKVASAWAVAVCRDCSTFDCLKKNAPPPRTARRRTQRHKARRRATAPITMPRVRIFLRGSEEAVGTFVIR